MKKSDHDFKKNSKLTEYISNMYSLNIFNKKVFSLLLLLIVIASISVASANE